MKQFITIFWLINNVLVSSRPNSEYILRQRHPPPIESEEQKPPASVSSRMINGIIYGVQSKICLPQHRNQKWQKEQPWNQKFISMATTYGEHGVLIVAVVFVAAGKAKNTIHPNSFQLPHGSCLIINPSDTSKNNVLGQQIR